MPQIMELEEPVEDERGYVYEKAAILDHIRQQERRSPGQCVCPVSGTTHIITAAGLRPARAVKQAQRRRRLGRQPQQAGQSRRRSGDVLDLG